MKIDSGKGAMPFAIIAVVLLVMTGAHVAISASMERNAENIDSMEDEMDAVEDHSQKVATAVSRSIGELVADISRNGHGGLIDRFDEFDSRKDGVLRSIFPISNGAATATFVDHDITISTRSFRVSDEASAPTYLKATGTVDVIIRSASCTSERTLNIDVDGTSGLPLLTERMSLFEMAAGGGGTLSNMIAYQLNAIAQYRVLQGYGAKNTYGEMGTESIITRSDAVRAFANAVSALELLSFRNVSEDADVMNDLARSMVADDGMMEVDMTAAYAQSLGSMVDSAVTRWLDYFMIDDILEIVDWFQDIKDNSDDSFMNGIRKILSIFSDIEEVTAGTYLRDAMSEHGVSENEYNISGTWTLCTPELRYTIDGMDTVMRPFDMIIGCPGTDIAHWDGWKGFVKEYRSQTNQMRATLTAFLNGLCEDIASSVGLLTISMAVDPGKNMIENIRDAVSVALEGSTEKIERIAKSSFAKQEFRDPLYSAILRKVETERDAIFRITDMKDSMEAQIRDALKSRISNEHGGTLLDENILDPMVSAVMESDEVKGMLSSYGGKADSCVSVIRNTMEGMTLRESDMRSLMSKIVSKGMMMTDIIPKMGTRLNELCQQFTHYISANPGSSLLELPDDDYFRISDGADGYVETMHVASETNVEATVRQAHMTEGNVHYTDMPWKSAMSAAYSSEFSVSMDYSIFMDVSSASALSAVLGTDDARCSKNISTRIDLNIQVLSGWPLAGVDYEPSRTVLDDAAELLLEALEPFIGPLGEMHSMSQSISEMLGSALMEAACHAASVIMKMQDMLYSFIDRIHKMFDDLMERTVERIVSIIELSLKSQTLGFSYMGFVFKVTTNLADAIFNSKTLLKIEVSLHTDGKDISTCLELKRTENDLTFAGTMSLKADTWDFKATIDPFMKMKKHLVSIDGTVRNTAFRIVMPELVQYDMLEFRLSDIPAIGAAISSIPLPIPGVKGDLDVGVQLKYGLPFKHSLVINEFESNPKGTDNGNEWVELYNPTSSSIDLEGMKLVPSSGEQKAHALSGRISAGERLVVTLPKQILNNSVGVAGNGEKLTLADRNGKEIDSTPWKADTKNDESTWQRSYDAGTEWTFKKSTKGAANGGKVMGGNAVKGLILNTLTDSVKDAFGETGTVKSIDSLSVLMKRTVEIFVDRSIDTIAGCVVEASLFAEIALTDYSGTLHAGIRASIVVDGEIVSDGLRWMASKVRSLLTNIDNPNAVDIGTILSDDIWVRGEVYGMITPPEILFPKHDDKISISAMTECNVSAVTHILGMDTGTWRVGFGVVLENIPAVLIPKNLKPNMERAADLWLIRAVFSSAGDR